MNWQPSASIAHLKKRAAILKSIRDFFAARDVLEVETPLLCHTSVTDPFIESIPASVNLPNGTQSFYLQTSPEYAMKRLLAAGSGSIYQLCKAFRQDEAGRYHNPEFTMLEWYRVNHDHHQLMNEMDDLLKLILNTASAERMSYQHLFLKTLHIDPLSATVAQLADCAKQNNVNLADTLDTKDDWLQLLMSHCIEPSLGQMAPTFVYDFPASQAALARINPDDSRVASRFEVYYKGIELANGFHELQNANEQRQRFENNLTSRKQLGLTALPIDENFLAALEHGLPDCAGVALGIDRLIMLALGAEHIHDVISFDIVRA